MLKRIVIAALLLTLLVAISPAYPASAQNGTLGGRSYYLYVPSSYDESAATPVPLVIALHPTSSSGRAMAVLTGLDAAAEEQGFIVVYPNSSGSVWGEDPTDPDLPDDVGFITALIDDLAQTYTIDPAQVHLAGWGNGGLMAYRLACEVPDRFVSVAVVGPLMWDYHRDACDASSADPLNLLIIHGTDDPFYTADTHLYESPWSPEQPTILGVDDTLSLWMLRNGCDLASTELEDHMRLFPVCQGGTRVAFYDVQGSRGNWPRDAGQTLNAFGIDATAMITSFFAGGDDWNAPQPPFDDQARTYTVYIPASVDPTAPTPVVVTLHGRFGSGAGTADYTQMNKVADEHGFIALYPDGLLNMGATYPFDTGWNYTYGVSFALDYGPDDAAFIDTLLDDLALALNIDQRRIYVDGMSNGGFMVHALACTHPDRFAAFGSVAGSGFSGFEELCEGNTSPVSMAIIHGLDDDNVLWDGRMQTVNGQEYWITYGVLDMMTFWTVHNGCDVEAVDVVDLPPGGDSPGTAVRILTANHCTSGAELQLYAVVGGGHNWPGVRDEEDASWTDLSKINMDINAGEALWEFFSRHALPEPKP